MEVHLPMLRYGLLTIRHKWFVFLAGFRTKAPIWRLIIHDWSKLLPSELPHYARLFYKKGNLDTSRINQFMVANLHHQNYNPHHWEYWIPRSIHYACRIEKYKANKPMPMPDWAIREMVADWLGAGRAYEDKWADMKNWSWFESHYLKMDFHNDTRQKLSKVLNEIGYQPTAEFKEKTNDFSRMG